MSILLKRLAASCFLLTLMGCPQDSTLPLKPQSDEPAWAALVDEDNCAVFGVVVSASTANPMSIPAELRSADEAEPFNADVRLAFSRLYGSADCLQLEKFEDRLRVFLRLQDHSDRPTLGERAVVFINAVKPGLAVGATPGSSYWSATWHNQSWSLRLGPDPASEPMSLDQALAPLSRVVLPIPDPEPPCGLNELIVIRRRELIESGKPWP